MSSSSYFDSDTSLMTSGLATPSSQLSQNMYLDGFNSDPGFSSAAYDDNTGFIAMGQSDNLAHGDFAYTLQSGQTSKQFAEHWPAQGPTFSEDAHLNIHIRHQDLGDANDISAGHHIYPGIHNMSSAMFTPTALESSIIPSWQGPLDIPVPTVSPQQICVQTPATSDSLATPFSTPCKKAKSCTRKARASTRRRSKTTKHVDINNEDLNYGDIKSEDMNMYETMNDEDVKNEDDTWSTMADDGQGNLAVTTPDGAKPKFKEVILNDGKKFMIPTHMYREQKSGRHYCILCPPKQDGKIVSFERKEHLTRHYDSIHNPNPHPCPYCKHIAEEEPNKLPKIFNRNDNRQQHIIKTHLTYTPKGRTKRLVKEEPDGTVTVEWKLIDDFGFRPIYEDMLLKARGGKEAKPRPTPVSSRKGKTPVARRSKKMEVRRHGSALSNFTPMLCALEEQK